MSSIDVLNKLLKRDGQLPKPGKTSITKPKSPGRPKVEDEKKARNFTLCLAPQYLQFLDKMIVKDKKVQGRGRKIRFIIDRFIEHEKRSISQIRVLKDSLSQVQVVLKGFGDKVKKGQKLELTSREKGEISKAVDQIHTLLKVLNYAPKTLKRVLPQNDWSILAFCLDWKNNRGVVL